MAGVIQITRNLKLITWLILHHNRPFFLDICVQHLRRWGLPDWRVVVLDSGSDKNIVDNLHKISGIDEIIHSANDPSGLISSALKNVRTEFVAFSEEDFIYAAQPLTREQIIRYYPFPEIYYDTAIVGWGYKEAIQIMFDQGVDYVLMTHKKSRIKNELFRPYHMSTNWPHIMKSEAAKSVDLPAGMHVAQMEYYLQQVHASYFKKTMRLQSGCHSHLGNWLSVNPAMTQIQINIRNRTLDMADMYGLPPEMGRHLNCLWLENRFCFDVDEFIRECSFKAMSNSFQRITQ